MFDVDVQSCLFNSILKRGEFDRVQLGTTMVNLKSVRNYDVEIRGQNIMEWGGVVILNPESGNSILLGTGARGIPPESGNSILDSTWQEVMGKIH